MTMTLGTNVKLTPRDVLEIRRLRGDGWSQSRLAKQFKVGINQIGKICRGEAWANITHGQAVLTDGEAQLRQLTMPQPSEGEISASLERLQRLLGTQGTTTSPSPLPPLSAEVSERAAAYLSPNGAGVEELIKSITPEMRQRSKVYGELMAQRQLEADAREAEARERERDRDKAQSTTTTTAENVQPAEAILNAERLLETLKDENQS